MLSMHATQQLSSMHSVQRSSEQAPVVACGGGLHTVVHCSLNAEGLDDLAALIKPTTTTTISSEIRQGQKGLHLDMNLQDKQSVIGTTVG